MKKGHRFAAVVTAVVACAGACTHTVTPSVDTSGGSGTPGVSGGSGSLTDAGDAGCSPLLAGFTPAYHPPASAKGSCTATQLEVYYNDCLGTAASSAACAPWSVANAACSACLVGSSSPTAASWGPLLEYTLLVDFDEGGCVALDQPQQTACAAALEAEEECTHAACDTVCGASAWRTMRSV